MCPALKIGHLQKQFVHALSTNVNRKGQAASKQNKQSEEQEEQNGGRTAETARDLRQGHGHGHGLVGRRVVTFNSRRQLCKHGKGKNEEDDVDNEVDDDDNVTSEGVEEKENACVCTCSCMPCHCVRARDCVRAVRQASPVAVAPASKATTATVLAG